MKKVDWKKVNETLAISQGQWIDNGYPIVFQLVTMIDDDKMHLIIYPETEQEIFQHLYDEAKKEFGDGVIAISSSYISLINQTMKLYTKDYVQFEWNDEYQEYFGNCG